MFRQDPNLDRAALTLWGWLGLGLILGSLVSLVLAAWAASVYGGVPAIAFFPIGIGTSVPEWFSVWGAVTDTMLVLGFAVIAVEVTRVRRRLEDVRRQRRLREQESRQLWDPPQE